MAIPAAVSVAGSVANMIGGQKQADVIRDQGAEAGRRLRLEHERTLGEATARIGASGFETTSESMTKYLADMTKEFQTQEDFLRKNTDRMADATSMSSLFTGLTGIGSSIFSFGKMSNWWGKAS
jgi:hypothetical protein